MTNLQTVETFPFGQSVLPRPASSTAPRDLYVLGAYPSGLHVRWVPPSLPGITLRPVKTLIVDNEPVPFWDGQDAADRFNQWVNDVGWQSAWGEARPASGEGNGPSGKWVDEHILLPLGVGREAVCISDCLDTSRLNANQARRVEDTYKPVGAALGLPECTLRPVPAGEAAIVREATEAHLDRLRNELRGSRPSTIVTLGNAALRVMSMLLTDMNSDPDAALRADGYGRPVEATFEGNAIRWLPLVHPRSGDRTPPGPASTTLGRTPTEFLREADQRLHFLCASFHPDQDVSDSQKAKGVYGPWQGTVPPAKVQYLPTLLR